MRKMPLADDVDLNVLARETVHFSGADLAYLAREAATLAIRATEAPADKASNKGSVPGANVAATNRVRITAELLARARSRVSPSVGAEERRYYEKMAARYCSSTQSLGLNVPRKYCDTQ